MKPSEIHKICEKYHIKNYTINSDMSISVNGHVDLAFKNLKSIPINFKEVDGYFNCSYNQLTSLQGCPETVGGDFYCDDSQLTSLEGCPETVGGDFYCNDNQLTSLEGCPETVGGDFYCDYNQITNFDGLPEFFEQSISIFRNPVHEIYELFERDPRCIYWIREFDVIMDMTVVRYRLEEVYHTLGMDIPKDIELKNYIQITNFDGLPEFFESPIYLSGNPVNEIYKLFKEDPRCIYWIREFGAIQGDEVVRDRLEEVYHTLGMDIPKNIELENYKLT